MDDELKRRSCDGAEDAPDVVKRSLLDTIRDLDDFDLADDDVTLVPPQSYVASPRTINKTTGEARERKLSDIDCELLSPDKFLRSTANAVTSEAAGTSVDLTAATTSVDAFPIMTADDVRDLQTSVSGATSRPSSKSQQQLLSHTSPHSSHSKVINTSDSSPSPIIVRPKTAQSLKLERSRKLIAEAKRNKEELLRKRAKQEHRDQLFAVGIQQEFSEKEINSVLSKSSEDVTVESFIKLLRENRGHMTSGNVRPPRTPSAPSPRKKKSKQDQEQGAAKQEVDHKQVPEQYYHRVMEEEEGGLDKDEYISSKVERLQILRQAMIGREASPASDVSEESPSPRAGRRVPVRPANNTDTIVIDDSAEDDGQESEAWLRIQKNGKPSKRQRKRERMRNSKQQQQQQMADVTMPPTRSSDAALPTLNSVKSPERKQATVPPTVRRETAANFAPTSVPQAAPTHPQVNTSYQGALAQASSSQMAQPVQACSALVPQPSQAPGAPALTFVPRNVRNKLRYIVIDGSNVAVA